MTSTVMNNYKKVEVSKVMMNTMRKGMRKEGML